MDVEFKDWNGDTQYLTTNWWRLIDDKGFYLCPIGSIWTRAVRSWGFRSNNSNNQSTLKYSIHNARIGIGGRHGG